MSVVTEFAAALEALTAFDPTQLGDGETLVELNRHCERLGAVRSRAAAAFDTSGEWQASGARSAAAWLATETNQPVPSCRRQVRLGRALRHMAFVEEAWLAGDIGEAQVGLLARARTPVTEDDFTRDEKSLVDDAERLRFSSFARVLAYWSYSPIPTGKRTRRPARSRGDACTCRRASGACGSATSPSTPSGEPSWPTS